MAFHILRGPAGVRRYLLHLAAIALRLQFKIDGQPHGAAYSPFTAPDILGSGKHDSPKIFGGEVGHKSA